ncbi:MAG TPA: cupin domain-containing protein [Croceibacterium sp.]|nr:cupin domain-containing protein [Croceibacterium sp.]
MRSVTAFAIAFPLAMLAACQNESVAQIADAAPLEIFQPAPGSNEVLREALSAAPGHELIVADLALGPNAVGEAHSHPWEEYLYVLGGSAIVDIEGLDPHTLGSGEVFVIPAKTVHTPRAGPRGVRAIVIRVHDDGDPVSIPATDAR